MADLAAYQAWALKIGRQPLSRSHREQQQAHLQPQVDFWCDKADSVKINSLKAAYFPLTLSNYYLNFPLTVMTHFRGPSFSPEHASAGFRLRAETMGLWHAMPLQPALRFAFPCPQRC
jgi:hypothetical protein